MRTLIQEMPGALSPETLAQRLVGQPGLVLLRCGQPPQAWGRYTLVAAQPFLVFRCWGSRCELAAGDRQWALFGDPWQVLDRWLARYELLRELDVPFPLGGAIGYWGYDLKNFVEPRLSRWAINDLELPDCVLGFYSSLVAFDHKLGRAWIVATGLDAAGDRSQTRAQRAVDWWRAQLESSVTHPEPDAELSRVGSAGDCPGTVTSTMSQAEFVEAVRRALAYIRQGHIYQVNLSHRLSAAWHLGGWRLYERLAAVSPAPCAAYLDYGAWQLVSSSPELFLCLTDRHIITRPIKGTRPRGIDPQQDQQLSAQLLASAKERAELVMITDLLRNDLGRVCEYGSVQVPELVRLERYAQVQHLVSTVQGWLRPGVTHLEALRACFPGGSVTGAPKVRAMEIIDELEPTARGPYTGALGYLGFNRNSQLSIIIRTALCLEQATYFHVGAGIVADSVPEAEYDETLSKAAGFIAALRMGTEPVEVAKAEPAA
jgi:para-aminobenzoate synthetase component 1